MGFLRVFNRSIGRRIVAVAAAGLGAAGCATEPPTNEETVADWFARDTRRIGISAGVREDPPTRDIRLETSTVGREAAKGAGGGALVGAGGVIGALVAGGPTMLLLLFPPTWIVVGGAGAAGAAVGAAVGAAGSEPIIEVRPLEAVPAAQAVFERLSSDESMAARLRDALRERLERRTRHRFAVVPPVEPPTRPRSEWIEERDDLDGLVEIWLTRVTLAIDKGDETEADPHAAVLFTARAKARFDTGERTVPIFPPVAEYRTSDHRLSEWRADGGRLLEAEIGKALEHLANELGTGLAEPLGLYSAIAGEEPGRGPQVARSPGILFGL